MSRIIYPSSFEQQHALFLGIKDKHEADASNSVLKPFIFAQKFDLNNDGVAGTAAQAHEKSRLILTRQSQNFSELRDIKFNPVFDHVKDCLQFLKILLKPNYKALGDWGAPVDTNGKIAYPANFIERTNIFKTLKAKHDTYAQGESPLAIYLDQNNIDLSNDENQVNAALNFHNLFQTTAKAAENETEQRDLLWEPVNSHLHQIGEYLKKLSADNTKTLGLWGFTVDSSPRAPKERTSTIKPGEKMTTAGVVLGSTLTNIGKTDLHIYSGKSTVGNPVIIQPAQSFGILKGYSIITVSNPSTLEKGLFKVLMVN